MSSSSHRAVCQLPEAALRNRQADGHLGVYHSCVLLLRLFVGVSFIKIIPLIGD